MFLSGPAGSAGPLELLKGKVSSSKEKMTRNFGAVTDRFDTAIKRRCTIMICLILLLIAEQKYFNLC